MRSVVLATYQGEEFISAQLDSIVWQLDPEDEVVVSDDASTDGTVSIIAARNDPRIRLIRNSKRVGYVRNFERAIASAKGQFIFFSDQDDVWLPNKVTTLSMALTSHACVATDAVVVDRDLRQVHASFFRLRSAENFSAFAVFFKPCFVGATIACTRSYLDRLLPFPAGVPHDFWITLNASWDADLTVIREPLIYYRRHSSTASVSATGRRRSYGTIVLERARILGAMLFRRTVPRVS
jgi:glycosyltransferase involved in cell wall biosynthesis